MKRLIIGVITGLALAGGVAYATIPDSSGVIHACMLNKIGTIRLIDPSAGQRCSSSLETAVSWNERGQQGVAGPAGLAGPAGPKGDQGDRGPSNAFQTVSSFKQLSEIAYDAATLTLPAGTFVVFAKATPQNWSGEEASSNCSLRQAGFGGLDTSWTTLQGNGELQTLALQAIDSGPDTVTLSCRVNTGAGVQPNWWLRDVSLTAIQVDDVDFQGGS